MKATWMILPLVLIGFLSLILLSSCTCDDDDDNDNDDVADDDTPDDDDSTDDDNDTNDDDTIDDDDTGDDDDDTYVDLTSGPVDCNELPSVNWPPMDDPGLPTCEPYVEGERIFQLNNFADHGFSGVAWRQYDLFDNLPATCTVSLFDKLMTVDCPDNLFWGQWLDPTGNFAVTSGQTVQVAAYRDENDDWCGNIWLIMYDNADKIVFFESNYERMPVQQAGPVTLDIEGGSVCQYDPATAPPDVSTFYTWTSTFNTGLVGAFDDFCFVIAGAPEKFSSTDGRYEVSLINAVRGRVEHEEDLECLPRMVELQIAFTGQE